MNSAVTFPTTLVGSRVAVVAVRKEHGAHHDDYDSLFYPVTARASPGGLLLLEVQWWEEAFVGTPFGGAS